ncbi:MAG: ribosome small subunit-dependent GTPase A [Alphaproteobacteria bacterium]
MRLNELGWRPFFAEQLDSIETETNIPVRVVAVHRGSLDVIGVELEKTIPAFDSGNGEGQTTIGDWLLLDPVTGSTLRRLDRFSVFKRRAAGLNNIVQLIATNVDTLMIVSSCNQDFNAARMERFLTLAQEAEVTPVVVLTKSDLAETPEDYRRAALELMPALDVVMLDATDVAAVESLRPWLGIGQTIAFLGSSGVGKSTLTNALIGSTDIATQSIRNDDAKGRHTTTHRALYEIPTGGWVLDTPGMRELQLTDVAYGLSVVFKDIHDLVPNCRFQDCKHLAEPGCAVTEAVASGELDASRRDRWLKLMDENEENTETAPSLRTTGRSSRKSSRGGKRGRSKR